MQPSSKRGFPLRESPLVLLLQNVKESILGSLGSSSGPHVEVVLRKQNIRRAWTGFENRISQNSGLVLKVVGLCSLVLMVDSQGTRFYLGDEAAIYEGRIWGRYWCICRGGLSSMLG